MTETKSRYKDTRGARLGVDRLLAKAPAGLSQGVTWQLCVLIMMIA